jgi:hypothetical protein
VHFHHHLKFLIKTSFRSENPSNFGLLIEETKVALDLFFDNKFDEAAQLLEQKWVK